MIISEIGIRGFKSFGNNEQTLKLNSDKGELILLTGSNGNGKSSFIESFEYVLYGKVKSMKKKKWATLGTLPNRINGELQNRIKFLSNGTEVEVIRGIGPSVLKLIENGLENDRAGKANIDEKIENYIGMDIETFKSFISMSINDFKNFISLSNEEKQLLLDKLFNLEVINLLNGILKDLVKTNKLQNAKFDSEISTLNSSIERIKQSIEKAIEKEKLNIQSEIDEIKTDMESRKGEYQQLKEKVEKIKQKDDELKSELETEREQHIKIGHDIKSAQKDIDLYESGKCPTCGTDFLNDHFVGLKQSLIDKKKSLDNIRLVLETNIKSIREKQLKLQTISEKTKKSFDDITYLLRNYKSQIDKLQQQKDNDSGKSNVNIQEFEQAISELEEKKSSSVDNQTVCKEKELYYKELSKIFGEDGVKKSIIAGIIKPINHFIQENIKKMLLPFQVKLDETFTAEIKQFGNTIDHDSLSTGETKKVNLCILIAYLKLIRTKKHINILFLDEVFSSMDIESCESILNLLKSFANDYKINIFVVHHAILNQEIFDRILSINKDVFTSINEVSMDDSVETERVRVGHYTVL
jgi:DNA repair exonuclease SbcCD ATPase subunit